MWSKLILLNIVNQKVNINSSTILLKPFKNTPVIKQNILKHLFFGFDFILCHFVSSIIVNLCPKNEITAAYVWPKMSKEPDIILCQAIFYASGSPFREGAAPSKSCRQQFVVLFPSFKWLE
jgi:hypothetical protein